MRVIKKGATSQSIYFTILDSASTTGGKKTGIVYNAAGLTAYYVLAGGSAVSITLATLAAANSAYSSGGFKEVDATNMPGLYRFDPPNAALTGAEAVVFSFKGATGMVQVDVEVQLLSVDLQDAVRGGMAALPNAAAEAAGGLYTRGTGAGQINQPANGRVDVNTIAVSGTTQTAGDIPARLPAALVSGRMDASVGAMAANVMTAAAAAADLTTELQSGLATAANLATLAGYVDTEVAGLVSDMATVLSRLSSARAGYLDNLSAGAVATAANLATVAGYLDTEIAQLVTDLGTVLTRLSSARAGYLDNLSGGAVALAASMPSAANNADAVLDEVVLGSYTMRQLLRGLAAGMMGKVAGAGTTTVTIRDLGDTKDVIVATVDSSGNRTAITLDLT